MTAGLLGGGTVDSEPAVQAAVGAAVGVGQGQGHTLEGGHHALLSYVRSMDPATLVSIVTLYLLH